MLSIPDFSPYANEAYQQVQKASEIDVQKSTKALVNHIVCNQLKSMPSIPDPIKMRVGELIALVETDPDNKKIKKDLYSLSTSHLYSSVVSSSTQKNLVVMGMVHDDGVGDYYHILNAAELIKKKFPDAKVTMLVCHMGENPPSGIRIPDPSQFEAIFCQWNHLPKNIYPVLKAAAQIIEMSQRIHRDQDIEDIIKQKGDKYKFIAEYGHWSEQSMGLKNNQLGIIIKDQPSTSSMLDLKNEELKKALFGTLVPTKEDLANYLKTHEPFIGYLKMGSYYQMGLIYTTAAFLKASEKQTIDLMIPPVKMEYLDMEFLKAQGIGKIKIIKIEKGQLFEKKILIAEKGKELRFINPFPLEQRDFHTLLAYTHLLVGCTGDHSFSEVISFDRLPFYELRPMKIEFHKQLIELAGYVGKEPHYLKQYFQELFNIYDYVQEKVINYMQVVNQISEQSQGSSKGLLEYFKKKQPQLTVSALKIAKLLHQPDLVEEFHELNELLRTQYSFNQTLQNIVERQLALNSHQDLQKIEKEIEENYLERKITLFQVNEQLTDKIKTFTA